MTDRITTCRYLRRRDGNRCTAEVAEADAEIDLCPVHLAAALELIRRRLEEVAADGP